MWPLESISFIATQRNEYFCCANRKGQSSPKTLPKVIVVSQLTFLESQLNQKDVVGNLMEVIQSLQDTEEKESRDTFCFLMNPSPIYRARIGMED